MSNNICYRDYPGDVDRKKVQADLDTYVSQATWQEGGHGLVHPIRWLDADPRDNYDEAEDFILLEDRRDYDSLAVRYREPDRDGQAGINAMAVRLREAEMSLKKSRAGENYPATRTSQYISCPECGSKLCREKLAGLRHPNRCPLCRCDLRPESVRKKHSAQVAKAQAALEKARADLEKAEKSAARKGKIRWLVKFEYHT